MNIFPLLTVIHMFQINREVSGPTMSQGHGWRLAQEALLFNQQDYSKEFPLFLITAPRLKDAVLSVTEAKEMYMNVMISVKSMFHVYKLVHGDLSENTILYYQGNTIIFGLSQSVASDHPKAQECLKKDLTNITHIFRKLGVTVTGLQGLFDWVVVPSQGWDEIEDELLLTSMFVSRTEDALVELKQLHNLDLGMANHSEVTIEDLGFYEAGEMVTNSPLLKKSTEGTKETDLSEGVSIEVTDILVTRMISVSIESEEELGDEGFIPQVDGDPGEPSTTEQSDRLLRDCKNILKKLLRDDYDRFEVLSIAEKFDLNLGEEATFSRMKYLLQLNILENILKEDQSDYYKRIYDETVQLSTVVKQTEYKCCLVGCLFAAKKHRAYVKHLNTLKP